MRQTFEWKSCQYGKYFNYSNIFPQIKVIFGNSFKHFSTFGKFNFSDSKRIILNGRFDFFAIFTSKLSKEEKKSFSSL